MKNTPILIQFFLLFSIFGSCNTQQLPIQLDNCLVFVHIGDHPPHYVRHSMAQARLFNPDFPIVFIANENSLQSIDLQELNAIKISIESLNKTSSHQQYERITKTKGFWRFALERFLVLDDFIQQFHLQSVFHIENDVMIYFSLEKFLPIFQSRYTNMITTAFDCDQRSVPCFVYFDNSLVSSELAQFIANQAFLESTDMHLLNEFKKIHYKKCADHLPILIPDYADDYPLLNIFKEYSEDPRPFYANLDAFQMIFDAAALGQYLGGIDPILGPSKPGFMGEASIFLPMFFSFQWIRDEQGRWIPWIQYKDKAFPIANLHIHCKALDRFSSVRQSPPALPIEPFSSLPFTHIQPNQKRK